MRRRISYEKLGYILLLIPLLKPESIEHMFPLLEVIYNIATVITGIIVTILYIKKVRKIDLYQIAIVCYFAVLIYTTVLNNGNIRGRVFAMLYSIVLMLLIRVLLFRGAVFCFEVFLPVLEIMIFINLVTVILFPDGIYSVVRAGGAFTNTECFFLGLDNSQTPYYVFAITISVLRTYFITGRTKLTLRNILLIAMCVATVLIRWQATAVVGLFILLTFILFPYFYLKTKVLNSWTYLAIGIAAFFLLVVFRMQDLFLPIIDRVLHKSATLSGRTRVWDRSIIYILMKPWTGYGSLLEEDVFHLIRQVHTHNMFLQVLFQGGILLFLPYLWMNILAAKRLYTNRNSVIASFLSLVLFSMMIMGLVENNGGTLWFLMVQFACETSNILSQQKVIIAVRRKRTLEIKPALQRR